MSSVFAYPKEKHHRTQTPPVYRDYKSYKPFLRTEFDRKCVYCRSSDGIKGREAFGVDHYRPKKLFPHLEAEYLNLFYCCNRCNSLKRSFWPLPAHKALKQFVPNPCEHVMFEHLRYRGEVVVTMSSAGEWTADLLLLNDPDLIASRKRILTVVAMASSKLNELSRTLKEIESREMTETNIKERGQLALARETVVVEIQNLQDVLSSFCD